MGVIRKLGTIISCFALALGIGNAISLSSSDGNVAAGFSSIKGRTSLFGKVAVAFSFVRSGELGVFWASASSSESFKGKVGARKAIWKGLGTDLGLTFSFLIFALTGISNLISSFTWVFFLLGFAAANRLRGDGVKAWDNAGLLSSLKLKALSFGIGGFLFILAKSWTMYSNLTANAKLANVY